MSKKEPHIKRTLPATTETLLSNNEPPRKKRKTEANTHLDTANTSACATQSTYTSAVPPPVVDEEAPTKRTLASTTEALFSDEEPSRKKSKTASSITSGDSNDSSPDPEGFVQPFPLHIDHIKSLLQKGGTPKDFRQKAWWTKRRAQFTLSDTNRLLFNPNCDGAPDPPNGKKSMRESDNVFMVVLESTDEENTWITKAHAIAHGGRDITMLELKRFKVYIRSVQVKVNQIIQKYQACLGHEIARLLSSFVPHNSNCFFYLSSFC